MQALRMDARQLIFLLAHAVDLVGVDDAYHGRRVGMLAVQLARALEWGLASQDLIYDAGLLHDCGVSTTHEHRVILDELEWAGVQTHCKVGAARLQRFPPLAHLAPIVRWHHTRWEAFDAEACDPITALRANLIFLADRIDALALACDGEDLLQTRGEDVRRRLSAYRGHAFAPVIVEAFLDASSEATFWEERHTTASVRAFQAAMGQRPNGVVIDWPLFHQASWLFQEIVDAKSPFTHEHSLGVARLARALAEHLGLDHDRCERIEIAGLLHDIGKLQIPDDILEAPRPLSDREFSTMRSHSRVTYELLHGMAGLEDVASWAASHHEKLDGSGYPFGRTADELPIEARIVAVADIYQALAQRRPYRGPMAASSVLDSLRNMAAAGAIDAGLVQVLASDLPTFHCAAVSEGEPAVASRRFEST